MPGKSVAKQRAPAQEPRVAHGTPDAGVDHQSSSTSTTTATTPSVLELATRQWEQAADDTFTALGAWWEAGDALKTPAEVIDFSLAAARGNAALQTAVTHEAEARAYEKAAPQDQRP